MIFENINNLVLEAEYGELIESSDSKTALELQDIFSDFSKRIEALARVHKIKLNGTLDSLRVITAKNIVDMKNGNYVPSRKQIKLMDLDLKGFLKDDTDSFKDAYIKELNKLISKLKSKSKDASWIKASELIKPFLGIEFDESIKEELDENFLVALNEDDLVNEIYSILTEAETDKKKPSLQPPKEWIEKMKKTISDTSPSYSLDRILRTIGDIWYHKLDKSKKSEIRNRYGKVFGETVTEANDMKDYIVTVDGLRIGRKDITEIGTKAVSTLKAYNQVMRREFMIDADVQDKAGYKRGIYSCRDGKQYKLLLKAIGDNYTVNEG